MSVWHVFHLTILFGKNQLEMCESDFFFIVRVRCATTENRAFQRNVLMKNLISKFASSQARSLCCSVEQFSHIDFSWLHLNFQMGFLDSPMCKQASILYIYNCWRSFFCRDDEKKNAWKEDGMCADLRYIHFANIHFNVTWLWINYAKWSYIPNIRAKSANSEFRRRKIHKMNEHRQQNGQYSCATFGNHTSEALQEKNTHTHKKKEKTSATWYTDVCEVLYMKCAVKGKSNQSDLPF